MTDYVARIRSKGLDATGVTEDVARQMYATLGSHTMMVVEVQHVRHSDDAEGKHSVELVITTAEPAQDEKMNNHLRELARGLYRRRPAVEGQEVLTGVGDDGPGLDDTISAGESLLERDDDGNVVGVWDGDTESPQDAPTATDGEPAEGWADGYPEGAENPQEASNVVAFSNGG